MTILVIGTPDSGKSEKAERLALDISGNGKKIYLATMIPYGTEGELRIQKHRKLRAGKGFVTIEKPHDIADVIGEPCLGKEGDVTVLLECVSNLCANEMFDKTSGRSGLSADKAAEKIPADILRLRDGVKNLVIVTNEFEPEETFDEETLNYVSAIKKINAGLRQLADKIYEKTKGEWKIYEDH